MGAITTQFSPVEASGQRLRDWLNDKPAKVLARQYNVSVKTAESWKAGNPPQFRHLLAMVDHWGAAFLEHLFAPVLEKDDATVEREIETLRRSLETLERTIKADAKAAATASTDQSQTGAAKGQAGIRAGSGRGKTLAGAVMACLMALGTMTPDAKARTVRTVRPVSQQVRMIREAGV